MIRITDLTLTTIDLKYVSADELVKLYSLLLQTGINYVEITIPVREMLGNCVDLSRTILRVTYPSEIIEYPGFVRYITRHSGFEFPTGTISEFQINDFREINLLGRNSDYQNIRIVGLDDLLQYDYVNVFRKLRRLFGSQLEFCPQNNYFCATALAVEWILNGGENLAVSFSGCGDFAALEEVIMALRIIKRHKPNLDLSLLREAKSLYQQLALTIISDKKPIIGDKIFEVESGIHVDGILKNGSNYEPFEPSVVGMERRIIAGKHSGRAAIEIKLKELGLFLTRERISELLNEVQHLSISLGRSISDQEFAKLAVNLTE